MLVGFSVCYVNGWMRKSSGLYSGKSSGIPITLANIEQLDSGQISIEESRTGEILVWITDRFGDSHVHVLHYEGVSTIKALEILTAKQKELEKGERAHWAILGGRWQLETNAVPEIINGSKAHLQDKLVQAASDLERTNIQSILTRWDYYSCQLVPFLDKEGRKMVLLRFFPSYRESSFKTWRTVPIQVEGGGYDYWSLSYDLEKREYFGFSVNAIE